MRMLQMPPNEGSSTYGVQEQALPLGRESRQDVPMWRERLKAAKEIVWGHWWFRIAVSAWVAISGYDTFSGVVSQLLPSYSLIPLGSVVMGGSHLLPWWGWLIVLQLLLLVSLAEWVVRNTRPASQDDLRQQIEELARTLRETAKTAIAAPTADQGQTADRLRGIARYIGAEVIRGQALLDWQWAISEGEKLLGRPEDDEWPSLYGAWRSGMKPWIFEVQDYFPGLHERILAGAQGLREQREVALKIVENLRGLEGDLNRALNPPLPYV